MFKKTLDMIPNGVLIIDIATKQITFANKEMEDIVNFKKQEGAELCSELLKEHVCQFTTQITLES